MTSAIYINSAMFFLVPPSGVGAFRQIAVGTTVTPGTLIHTAYGSASVVDVISLEANKATAAAAVVTVEFAGAAAADLVVVTVPAQDKPTQIIVDRPLEPGAQVRVFSPAGVNIYATIKRYQAVT